MLATPIFTISSTNFNSQKGEYLKQYASALENRHLVLAKRLVELERVPLRAQIRDPFEDKETPALFFTIKTHFHEMFDYLIAKGHENEEISRVIVFIKYRGIGDLPSFLQDSEGNTVLMIATQYENEYVLYQYLSLYPKSIHVKNNRGESAMAVAARYGNAHVVQVIENSILRHLKLTKNFMFLAVDSFGGGCQCAR